MSDRSQDVPPDAPDGGPRVAIHGTSGKPSGWLLVGNRAGLLELAAQLQRIAKAPAGTDTGHFSMMPYYKDLEALRCRKNIAGGAGAILGVVVNEAIDEPDQELLAPVKHGIVARALGALFWIGLLLLILLGAKELIRLLDFR